MSHSLDIDHVPTAVTDTLDAYGKRFQQTRVRGEGGTFSITRVYHNATGELVVDCAGSQRCLRAITLDRLEKP